MVRKIKKASPLLLILFAVISCADPVDSNGGNNGGLIEIPVTKYYLSNEAHASIENLENLGAPQFYGNGTGIPDSDTPISVYNAFKEYISKNFSFNTTGGEGYTEVSEADKNYWEALLPIMKASHSAYTSVLAQIEEIKNSENKYTPESWVQYMKPVLDISATNYEDAESKLGMANNTIQHLTEIDTPATTIDGISKTADGYEIDFNRVPKKPLVGTYNIEGGLKIEVTSASSESGYTWLHQKITIPANTNISISGTITPAFELIKGANVTISPNGNWKNVEASRIPYPDGPPVYSVAEIRKLLLSLDTDGQIPSTPTVSFLVADKAENNLIDIADIAYRYVKNLADNEDINQTGFSVRVDGSMSNATFDGLISGNPITGNTINEGNMRTINIKALFLLGGARGASNLVVTGNFTHPSGGYYSHSFSPKGLILLKNTDLSGLQPRGSMGGVVIARGGKTMKNPRIAGIYAPEIIDTSVQFFTAYGNFGILDLRFVTSLPEHLGQNDNIAVVWFKDQAQEDDLIFKLSANGSRPLKIFNGTNHTFLTFKELQEYLNRGEKIPDPLQRSRVSVKTKEIQSKPNSEAIMLANMSGLTDKKDISESEKILNLAFAEYLKTELRKTKEKESTPYISKNVVWDAIIAKQKEKVIG